MDNSEMFRNEFIQKLSETLPPDQIIRALSAFDLTSSGYEIERKSVEIITFDGIPEVVKHFIASKSIQNCSMGTLKQYRYKLIDFFNAVRKSYLDINAADIRLYLANFKKSPEEAPRRRRISRNRGTLVIGTLKTSESQSTHFLNGWLTMNI